MIREQKITSPGGLDNMRYQFDQELKELNQDMISMGVLCETAISKAMRAMDTNNHELAKQAIDEDQSIDAMERDIERLCLRLLLEQQPVATDLRQVSSALKMITDMERIGDQASDISEIVLTSNLEQEAANPHLKVMSEQTIKMVNQAVDAYVKKDYELTREVIKGDDIVDTYFDKVRKDLIKKIAEKPEDGERAIDTLLVAKYLERIGDHATNIAEWVQFAITGNHVGVTI